MLVFESNLHHLHHLSSNLIWSIFSSQKALDSVQQAPSPRYDLLEIKSSPIDGYCIHVISHFLISWKSSSVLRARWLFVWFCRTYCSFHNSEDQLDLPTPYVSNTTKRIINLYHNPDLYWENWMHKKWIIWKVVKENWAQISV